jgi:hypothetical protein
MARHKANHVQLAYATSAEAADPALLVRAALAESLGIEVHLCGARKDGRPWSERVSRAMPTASAR